VNTECECNYCKCGDQPFDEELTLEMRLDIAEAALMGIRQHLWQLDYKLKDLYEWAEMKEYQIQDVNLLVDLYDILLPWINNHPHVAAANGVVDGCKNCGGTNIIKAGKKITTSGANQRHQCTDCGVYMTGARIQSTIYK